MIEVQAKRDQVAIRPKYAQEVIAGTLLTIFRPGIRLGEHPKSYRVGQRVFLRIIKTVGDDALGIDPVFFDWPNASAIVTNTVAKLFDNLDANDFIGSSRDVQDKAGLSAQLAHIYKITNAELCGKLWVTRTRLCYLRRPLSPHI